MNDPIDIQDGACEPKKKGSQGGQFYPMEHRGNIFKGASIRTMAAMHFMSAMMQGAVQGDPEKTHYDPKMAPKIAFDAAQAFVDEMEKRDAL